MLPRIYHLHPLVAGALQDWPAHFARCREMAFDTVCIAPPFVPGASGDIFATADHEALHPALHWSGTADQGIAEIADQASRYGLRIWLDLAIDQVAVDAPIRQRKEGWFASGHCGAPLTPLQAPRQVDMAYAQLQQTDIAEAVATWWLDRLSRLRQAGVSGFRCLNPDRVPPTFWRRIIGELAPCEFLAWTPGLDRSALARMEGTGFGYTCSSLAWWDGRAPWFVEEYDLLRRIAPAIASDRTVILRPSRCPSAFGH